MLRAIRILTVSLFLLTMAVPGCVSTTLQTDWRDPGYSGRFNKVLVICLAKEMVVRNTLEDDFIAQFGQRGVQAVQSYTLLPSLKDIDKETVRRKVKELGADGVLLVRQIGRDSVVISQGNTQFYAENNYYDAWGAYSRETYFQTTSIDVYKVETSLYAAANGKIIWQALSETYEDGPWMETLNNFATIMLTKLSVHGLI